MEPEERFSSRAEWYAKYRPEYPEAVVDVLEREGGLRPGMMVADVGAGTGLSSELFLRRGYAVTAVEPNEAMRREATARLGGNPAFWALNGTGERTGLPAGSVDSVVCAQAFHWLRAEEAGVEWRRILRPGGVAAVLWNRRVKEASSFGVALESLLDEFSNEYRTRLRADHDAAIGRFAGVFGAVESRVLPWTEALTWEQLEGRMMSASYVPLPGDDLHVKFLQGLLGLFGEHQREGRVELAYETRLYWSCVRVP
ncbi:MAG: class I SAM-dependent methyltransferase [Bryobacteraceae bacterium]|nr:class I SAM-dependent methyltransferase [Bryobacteraceae bacterium]